MINRRRFVSDSPILLGEWNWERNDKLGIKPSDVLLGSSIKVWWKCSKNHQWEAKVNNRSNGRGCPFCSNKRVSKGYNDLCTTHPNIAKEWDYSKNEKKPYEVSYGYGKKVWWICDEGHSYEATVNHRTGKNGTGCPICYQGRQTSFAEQALYYYIRQIYPNAINRYKDIFDNGMELDIFIPSINLGIEYDGEAWHKEYNFKRELRKYKICQNNNIKLIRLKEKRYKNDFLTADTILHIDEMYKKENLYKAILHVVSEIDPKTNKWTRKRFDQWYSDLEINIEKDENDIRKYMTTIPNQSLQYLHPKIAMEWNYHKNKHIKPNMVTPGSDIKVWWICPECNNEYYSSISHRVSGTGCPECGKLKSAVKRSKKIVAYDYLRNVKIKSFPSISEAARKMNVSVGNIHSVLNGKRKHTKGYSWKYDDASNKDK